MATPPLPSQQVLTPTALAAQALARAQQAAQEAQERAQKAVETARTGQQEALEKARAAYVTSVQRVRALPGATPTAQIQATRRLQAAEQEAQAAEIAAKQQVAQAQSLISSAEGAFQQVFGAQQALAQTSYHERMGGFGPSAEQKRIQEKVEAKVPELNKLLEADPTGTSAEIQKQVREIVQSLPEQVQESIQQQISGQQALSAQQVRGAEIWAQAAEIRPEGAAYLRNAPTFVQPLASAIFEARNIQSRLEGLKFEAQKAQEVLNVAKSGIRDYLKDPFNVEKLNQAAEATGAVLAAKNFEANLPAIQQALQVRPATDFGRAAQETARAAQEAYRDFTQRGNLRDAFLAGELGFRAGQTLRQEYLGSAALREAEARGIPARTVTALRAEDTPEGGVRGRVQFDTGETADVEVTPEGLVSFATSRGGFAGYNPFFAHPSKLGGKFYNPFKNQTATVTVPQQPATATVTVPPLPVTSTVTVPPPSVFEPQKFGPIPVGVLQTQGGVTAVVAPIYGESRVIDGRRFGEAVQFVPPYATYVPPQVAAPVRPIYQEARIITPSIKAPTAATTTVTVPPTIPGLVPRIEPTFREAEITLPPGFVGRPVPTVEEVRRMGPVPAVTRLLAEAQAVPGIRFEAPAPPPSPPPSVPVSVPGEVSPPLFMGLAGVGETPVRPFAEEATRFLFRGVEAAGAGAEAISRQLRPPMLPGLVARTPEEAALVAEAEREFTGRFARGATEGIIGFGPTVVGGTLLLAGEPGRYLRPEVIGAGLFALGAGIRERPVEFAGGIVGGGLLGAAFVGGAQPRLIGITKLKPTGNADAFYSSLQAGERVKATAVLQEVILPQVKEGAAIILRKGESAEVPVTLVASTNPDVPAAIGTIKVTQKGTRVGDIEISPEIKLGSGGAKVVEYVKAGKPFEIYLPESLRLRFSPAEARARGLTPDELPNLKKGIDVIVTTFKEARKEPGRLRQSLERLYDAAEEAVRKEVVLPKEPFLRDALVEGIRLDLAQKYGPLAFDEIVQARTRLPTGRLTTAEAQKAAVEAWLAVRAAEKARPAIQAEVRAALAQQRGAARDAAFVRLFGKRLPPGEQLRALPARAQEVAAFNPDEWIKMFSQELEVLSRRPARPVGKPLTEAQELARQRTTVRQALKKSRERFEREAVGRVRDLEEELGFRLSESQEKAVRSAVRVGSRLLGEIVWERGIVPARARFTAEGQVARLRIQRDRDLEAAERLGELLGPRREREVQPRRLLEIPTPRRTPGLSPFEQAELLGTLLGRPTPAARPVRTIQITTPRRTPGLPPAEQAELLGDLFILGAREALTVTERPVRPLTPPGIEGATVVRQVAATIDDFGRVAEEGIYRGVDSDAAIVDLIQTGSTRGTGETTSAIHGIIPRGWTYWIESAEAAAGYARGGWRGRAGWVLKLKKGAEERLGILLGDEDIHGIRERIAKQPVPRSEIEKVYRVTSRGVFEVELPKSLPTRPSPPARPGLERITQFVEEAQRPKPEVEVLPGLARFREAEPLLQFLARITREQRRPAVAERPPPPGSQFLPPAERPISGPFLAQEPLLFTGPKPELPPKIIRFGEKGEILEVVAPEVSKAVRDSFPGLSESVKMRLMMSLIEQLEAGKILLATKKARRQGQQLIQKKRVAEREAEAEAVRPETARPVQRRRTVEEITYSPASDRVLMSLLEEMEPAVLIQVFDEARVPLSLVSPTLARAQAEQTARVPLQIQRATLEFQPAGRLEVGVVKEAGIQTYKTMVPPPLISQIVPSGVRERIKEGEVSILGQRFRLDARQTPAILSEVAQQQAQAFIQSQAQRQQLQGLLQQRLREPLEEPQRVLRLPRRPPERAAPPQPRPRPPPRVPPRIILPPSGQDSEEMRRRMARLPRALRPSRRERERPTPLADWLRITKAEAIYGRATHPKSTLPIRAEFEKSLAGGFAQFFPTAEEMGPFWDFGKDVPPKSLIFPTSKSSGGRNKK